MPSFGEQGVGEFRVEAEGGLGPSRVDATASTFEHRSIIEFRKRLEAAH